MTSARHVAASIGLLLTLSGAIAAHAADATPAEPERQQAAARDGEPRVQYTVIEDDATRIEELKVRGQTQRMTVTPKGLKSYEILPADQGRDMSDSAGSQRGAAGKRVWRIITF
jgi:hypothetical protein